MTADEYLGIGETDERYELIDGVVVTLPSPLPLHSEIALDIACQLSVYVSHSPGVRVFAGVDVCLQAAVVYRPDIAVYLPGRLPAKVDRLDLSPDLVVEVLSQGTKAFDLITNRDDYERFGVGEYWTIDPADARFRGWTRSGARLIEMSADADSVVSKILAGFTLDLKPVRKLASAP